MPSFCSWSAWYWFDGSTATTAIPLNYNPVSYGRDTTPTSPRSADWQYNYSFMSRHPGGANFGTCDGGVHWINQSIDLPTYQGLSTIDGGELVTLPN